MKSCEVLWNLWNFWSLMKSFEVFWIFCNAYVSQKNQHKCGSLTGIILPQLNKSSLFHGSASKNRNSIEAKHHNYSVPIMDILSNSQIHVSSSFDFPPFLSIGTRSTSFVVLRNVSLYNTASFIVSLVYRNVIWLCLSAQWWNSYVMRLWMLYLFSVLFSLSRVCVYKASALCCTARFGVML